MSHIDFALSSFRLSHSEPSFEAKIFYLVSPTNLSRSLHLEEFHPAFIVFVLPR